MGTSERTEVHVQGNAGQSAPNLEAARWMAEDSVWSYCILNRPCLPCSLFVCEDPFLPGSL
jgi:hypothetical protein